MGAMDGVKVRVIAMYEPALIVASTVSEMLLLVLLRPARCVVDAVRLYTLFVFVLSFAFNCADYFVCVLHATN